MHWTGTTGSRAALRSLVTVVALAGGLLLTSLPGSAAVGAQAQGHSLAPGTITTFAGGPGGLARATRVALMQVCALTYAHGNVYSTEQSPASGANYMIGRTRTRTDRLATVAGGGGVGSVPDGGKASGGLQGSQSVSGACGIAVDHHGNLFTLGPDQIRVVAGSTGSFYGQQMLAGHVYTIAGTGVSGYAGDGGPAVDAELRFPSGMAVDSSGNVIFADNGNQRVRVVAAATGTFYGVPMTAGDIYTVAGTGAKGYTGDGCAATTAQIKITFPVGVAGIQIDHAGNLVIADTGNFALRVVAAANGTFYRTAMQAGHIYTVAAGHLPAPGTGCGAGADRKAVVRPGFRAVWVAVDRAGNLVTTGGGYLWVDATATGTFYGHRMPGTPHCPCHAHRPG